MIGIVLCLRAEYTLSVCCWATATMAVAQLAMIMLHAYTARIIWLGRHRPKEDWEELTLV